MSPSTLLELRGTVPIYYKGAQYNIPVCIWIPEAYPHAPPVCYVTPTHDMCVKPKHRHVDTHGMVYLPYLNEWTASRSSLSELTTIMSSVFSGKSRSRVFPFFKVVCFSFFSVCFSFRSVFLFCTTRVFCFCYSWLLGCAVFTYDPLIAVVL
jgi:hypothetical protein